eukprot:Selendium_serpulae@DN6348_c0_g3_i1.p1
MQQNMNTKNSNILILDANPDLGLQYDGASSTSSKLSWHIGRTPKYQISEGLWDRGFESRPHPNQTAVVLQVRDLLAHQNPLPELAKQLLQIPMRIHANSVCFHTISAARPPPGSPHHLDGSSSFQKGRREPTSNNQLLLVTE